MNNMLTVINIHPNLINTYGPTMTVGRDKALMGVTKGFWKIKEPNATIKSIQPIEVIPIETEADSNYGRPLISIIIPVLNQFEFTKQCLDSIKKHTKVSYQIILVDNGSSQNVIPDFLSLLDKKDVYIRNPKNQGFSFANNQGLKIASGEYIFFLNNDTKILGDRWHDIFLEKAKNGDLIGASKKNLIVDHLAKIFIFIGETKDNEEWAYLEGWCLFGKRILFNSVAGFDERFSPAYSEDADLSFKVKRLGKRLITITAPIVHFANKTSAVEFKNEELKKISFTNRKKLYDKYFKTKKILLIRKGAIGDVLMITPIISAFKKNNPNVEIYVQTNCPQMLEGNPHITKIFRDLPDNFAADNIIPLEYEASPGHNRIDTMARQANVKLKSRKMEIFFAESTIDLPIKPYVVLHTGRTWPNREWDLKNFEKVAKFLISKKYNIVQIGDKNTQIIKSIKSKNLIDAPWRDIAKVMKNAAFFLGIDSACSNLAKALSLPAFIIYGCVNPDVMQSDTLEFPLIVDDLDCKGCRDKTSNHYVECIHHEIYCLTKLTPEYVIENLTNYIKSIREES